MPERPELLDLELLAQLAVSPIRYLKAEALELLEAPGPPTRQSQKRPWLVMAPIFCHKCRCPAKKGWQNCKTKMFHIFSPYVLHLFFRFSLNFPSVKTETVLITRRQMFARTLGRSRPLFTPVHSCCAKMLQSATRLLRRPTLYLLWQCP